MKQLRASCLNLPLNLELGIIILAKINIKFFCGKYLQREIILKLKRLAMPMASVQQSTMSALLLK
jgi:hypothetical protein